MGESVSDPGYPTRLVDAMNMNPGDKILVGDCVYLLMINMEMGPTWVTLYFTEEDNKSETADLILMMPIDRNLEVLVEF